jgi:hypothetical protein
MNQSTAHAAPALLTRSVRARHTFRRTGEGEWLGTYLQDGGLS